MRVEHLAIDGSVVALDADADLSSGCTTTGWAISPALMRSYPFTVFPPGYSAAVEDNVRSAFPEVRLRASEDYSMKEGNLRVVHAEVPVSTGGNKTLTVGAWEGTYGCLTTSLSGIQPDLLVEIFDTLDFEDDRRGVFIRSRVLPRPRPPEVIKEVPELGLVHIRPATNVELEGVPKSAGASTGHGELFRIRSSSAAIMFVTPSAVVRIQPLPDADRRTMMAVASGLRVEWQPRPALLQA